MKFNTSNSTKEFRKNRKNPIFSIIILIAIGIFSSIRIFTSASNQETSPLRETKPLSELTTNFNTSKV